MAREERRRGAGGGALVVGTYHEQSPEGVVEEDDRGSHEHGDAYEFVKLCARRCVSRVFSRGQITNEQVHRVLGTYHRKNYPYGKVKECIEGKSRLNQGTSCRRGCPGGKKSKAPSGEMLARNSSHASTSRRHGREHTGTESCWGAPAQVTSSGVLVYSRVIFACRLMYYTLPYVSRYWSEADGSVRIFPAQLHL